MKMCNACGLDANWYSEHGPTPHTDKHWCDWHSPAGAQRLVKREAEMNPAIRALLDEKVKLGTRKQAAKQRILDTEREIRGIEAQIAQYDAALIALGHEVPKAPAGKVKSELVPSRTTTGKYYIVDTYSNGKATCTCEDFKIRRHQCKHLSSKGLQAHLV